MALLGRSYTRPIVLKGDPTAGAVVPATPTATVIDAPPQLPSRPTVLIGSASADIFYGGVTIASPFGSLQSTPDPIIAAAPAATVPVAPATSLIVEARPQLAPRPTVLLGSAAADIFYGGVTIASPFTAPPTSPDPIITVAPAATVPAPVVSAAALVINAEPRLASRPTVALYSASADIFYGGVTVASAFSAIPRPPAPILQNAVVPSIGGSTPTILVRIPRRRFSPNAFVWASRNEFAAPNLPRPLRPTSLLFGVHQTGLVFDVHAVGMAFDVHATGNAFDAHATAMALDAHAMALALDAHQVNLALDPHQTRLAFDN